MLGDNHAFENRLNPTKQALRQIAVESERKIDLEDFSEFYRTIWVFHRKW